MNTSLAAEPTVETLGEPEALALLGQGGVGRIAFIDGRGVMVLPVNYIVAEGVIAFRSDSQSMLQFVPMRRVAFEVDGADTGDSVWSVVARGHAREVGEALDPEYERLRANPVPTIVPGPPRHWFTIEVESVSGRRISSASYI